MRCPFCGKEIVVVVWPLECGEEDFCECGEIRTATYFMGSNAPELLHKTDV